MKPLLLVLLAAISGPLGLLVGTIFGMNGAIVYTIGVVFGVGLMLSTRSKDNFEIKGSENVQKKEGE